MSDVISRLITSGIAGVVALGLTMFATPLVRAVAVRGGWISRPKGDRWGRRIVARFGGVGMFISVGVVTLLWIPMDRFLIVLLIGASLVFALGLFDDVRRLPPYTKLIAQLLIGCMMVIGGIRIELIEWAWLSIPLSVLWFVFAMNAFNLLDNMDGLAAGIGALAAGFCAYHAVMSGQWMVVSLSMILCGSCLGFLWSNFPPAKIYMGGSGSHFLGLMLATLALLGSWHHSTQLLSVLAVPVLVLAVPIFDTVFVTIQRLLHGLHPFSGGTDHVSHRLAILGLSTRQTVLSIYAISACLGLLSVVSLRVQIIPAIVIWVIVFSILLLFGSYLAKVNVYKVVPKSALPLKITDHSTTLIDTMLLHKRRLVEILVDFCLISSAYVIAHLLRYERTH